MSTVRTDEHYEGLQRVHVDHSRQATEQREHRRHREQYYDHAIQTEFTLRPQH